MKNNRSVYLLLLLLGWSHWILSQWDYSKIWCRWFYVKKLAFWQFEIKCNKCSILLVRIEPIKQKSLNNLMLRLVLLLLLD